jgi:hypothetical protein
MTSIQIYKWKTNGTHSQSVVTAIRLPKTHNPAYGYTWNPEYAILTTIQDLGF